MQPYSLALECLWQDPAARFKTVDHRRILAPIIVALTKPYIDAILWLLNDRAVTYIACLPQDVLRYVIKPYLWSGKALCGIPHRDDYIYGVIHGIYRDIDGSIFHYDMGLLHRVDGPALIAKGQHIYYQHGRMCRESGPIRVSLTGLGYQQPNHLHAISRSGPRSIWFRPGLSVNSYASTNGIDWCTARHRLTIVGKTARIQRGFRHESFQHSAFGVIFTVLLSYFNSYDIDGECSREWTRTQAEIAND